MADCIWCERATKTCKACGQRVCPKHANKANGCCLPCLEAVQDAVRQGRCTDQAEEEEIEAIGGAEAATYGEITPLGFRALAARLGLCADCRLPAAHAQLRRAGRGWPRTSSPHSCVYGAIEPVQNPSSAHRHFSK